MFCARFALTLLSLIVCAGAQSYGLEEEQFAKIMLSWRKYKANQCEFEPPAGYLKFLPPKSHDAVGQQVPLVVQQSYQVYRLYEVDDFAQTLEIQFNAITAWRDEQILENGTKL